MDRDARLAALLPRTLTETNLPLGTLRSGKVRDVYELGDRLLLVASDRLSAFDVILTTIPGKGEVLTGLAEFWFAATADLCPNHLISRPDPVALLTRRCRPLAVEVVVRGQLTGSLWRDLQAGRDPYELKLPPGLRKDQAFETPVLTPTTKAPVGTHDEPLSERELLARGIVAKEVWEQVRGHALALFARGRARCAERGLLLVDTKYEFGLDADGTVRLIDELHTPDSSRFWELDEYEARLADGREQKMLDKENVRQWLIRERGFSGHGAPPSIPDDVRLSTARVYADAFGRITGARFQPTEGDPLPRLVENLRRAGLS
jgi:phosphoribosylaminoimidazole-succinocarboxamide synthase